MLFRLLFNKKIFFRRYMATKKVEGDFIVACCQMTSTIDKESNLKKIEKMVSKAKAMEARIVFLPEASDYIALSRFECLSLAETLDGPYMAAYRTIANKYSIWISIGGVHELIPNVDNVNIDSRRLYNTHVVIDDKGSIVQVYRKIHLFDVLIPEKNIDMKESRTTNAGNELVAPVATPVGNVGLLTCYDIRFPELSILLRKMGADILCYPSAFTHSTGEAHWEPLLRARAIETQSYVIAPAQVGRHNERRISHGRAMIIDPWGNIVAECFQYQAGYVEPGMICVTNIDHAAIQSTRNQMPLFKHRRPDIYNLELVGNNLQFTEIQESFVFGENQICDSVVFVQTTHSFGFTNIRCVVPGHVLVASLRPVAKLKQLTSEEISDLFQTCVKVQNAVSSLYKATSSTVVVQDGEDAGQTVKHVHVHILPRRKNDFKRNDDIYEALAKHDAPGSKVPERLPEEMAAEAARIKKVMMSSVSDK